MCCGSDPPPKPKPSAEAELTVEQHYKTTRKYCKYDKFILFSLSAIGTGTVRYVRTVSTVSTVVLRYRYRGPTTGVTGTLLGSRGIFPGR